MESLIGLVLTFFITIITAVSGYLLKKYIDKFERFEFDFIDFRQIVYLELDKIKKIKSGAMIDDKARVKINLVSDEVTETKVKIGKLENDLSDLKGTVIWIKDNQDLGKDLIKTIEDYKKLKQNKN